MAWDNSWRCLAADGAVTNHAKLEPKIGRASELQLVGSSLLSQDKWFKREDVQYVRLLPCARSKAATQISLEMSTKHTRLLLPLT